MQFENNQKSNLFVQKPNVHSNSRYFRKPSIQVRNPPPRLEVSLTARSMLDGIYKSQKTSIWKHKCFLKMVSSGLSEKNAISSIKKANK